MSQVKSTAKKQPVLVKAAEIVSVPTISTSEDEIKNIFAVDSVLIADAGTRKITRQELARVSTPMSTKTYKPISHIRLVEALIETLSFRHITVVNDEYAISKDGRKCFGLLELSEEFSGCRFALGIRNSHDRHMRLAMTVGLKVMVCSNMAFQGDFTPIRVKHSQKLDLLECVSIGVDRIQRNFKPLKNQVERYKEEFMSNEEVRLIIYEAFVDKKLPLSLKLLPLVHQFYFKPEHDEFKDPSLWCLWNAFTSAFKHVKPIPQFELTAKLGNFIERFAAPF